MAAEVTPALFSESEPFRLRVKERIKVNIEDRKTYDTWLNSFIREMDNMMISLQLP